MGTAIDLQTLPPALRENPFFDFSEDTHFVPAWDRIEPEHFKPAMDYAISLTREKVAAIKENKARPNFTNTVEALDEAFELIGYFSLVMYNMMPASKEEEALYDQLQSDINGDIAQLYSDVFSDPELFARVDKFQRSPSYKALSTEKTWLADMYYNGFADARADTNEKTRKEIHKLEQRITALGIKAQQNMKKAARESHLIVDNEDDLAGLSPFTRQAAAQRAEDAGHPGKWLFTVESESFAPFMQNAENRDLRKKLWSLHNKQNCGGPYNNTEIIVELNRLQQQYAKKAGYRNFATMTIQYETARTPGRVGKFLREIKKTAKPVAKDELKALQAFAKTTDGLDKLEPWDVGYYQDRMKKQALGFNDEQLRSYFEFENVLQGTFDHYEKLFGLHFEQTDEYPLYHDDVRAYNVTNARSGKHMGVLFLDAFAREGKPAGIAWNMSVLPQGRFMGKNRRTVDMVVCKFPQAKEGEPTLLTHDDVLTLFHEFGHAAHNLLSRCRYQSLSGSNVVTDFVEFPSQIQENWAWEPEVLKTFAFHYQTGEPMPDDMLQKLKESRKFMAGMHMLERARLGRLDLSWAQADHKKLSCAADFERAATAHYTLFKEEFDGFTSPHFSYGFGGGYDSCYYSYQWCQAMDAQAFSLFERDGLYNRSHASRLRKLYEAGSTREARKLFREFTQGQSVTLSKFFKREGLLSERFNYEAANDNEWEWEEQYEPPPAPWNEPRSSQPAP